MARGKRIETPVVSEEIETPVVSDVMINVFNKKKATVERISVSELDKTIHFNRNSHAEFTEEEIKAFKK